MDLEQQLIQDLASDSGFEVGGSKQLGRDNQGRFTGNDEVMTTGLASVEEAHGFRPIEMPFEDAIIEQQELEAAIESLLQEETEAPPVQHPDELSPVPATYIKTDGSFEPLDPTITLTPEKAGADLVAHEGNLATYWEGVDRDNLVDAVDAARAEVVKNNPDAEREYGISKAEVAARATKQEAEQPVEAEQRFQAEQPVKADEYPGLDPEAAKALANPQIREMLESQVSQNEQARQQYVAALQAANQVSYARLNSLLPDIAALPVQHREGAFMHLAQSDPQRFNAAVAELNSLQQVIASQQQQSQYSEARTQHEFDTWAKAEDAALGKMPGGKVSASDQQALLDYLPEIGLNRESYAQMLMTDRTARSALGQRLMLDAARGHAIRNAPRAMPTRTVPNVSRPGTADTRSSKDVSISQLDQRLSATGSVDDAWNLYQARNRR